MKRDSNDELELLLQCPDKRYGEARDVLSKLFRNILINIEMNPNKWQTLMTRYLLDPRNGIANNSRQKSSERNNFNRAISKATMTWKQFIKAVRFLGVTGFETEVRLRWRNNMKTMVKLDVDFASYEEPDDDAFDFSKLGPAGNDDLYQAPLTVIPGGKTPEQICAEIQGSLGEYPSGQ